MSAPIPTQIDLDEVLAHSFRDFHAKGLDYVCLRRSPTLTHKLYFLDGDVAKLPEVINPHDHRYPFGTWVVAGRSQNVWYDEGIGRTFNRFRYRTPLNGGVGFEWDGEVAIRELARGDYVAGTSYRMRADEIHTIRMLENETVLFLAQYEDVVPIGMPTKTFSLAAQPPSLDGLYGRFTADQLRDRLRRFSERTGHAFPDLT
jgi:hypothetical protein